MKLRPWIELCSGPRINLSKTTGQAFFCLRHRPGWSLHQLEPELCSLLYGVRTEQGKKNTNGKYLLTYQVVDIGMMRFWSGDRDILSIPYNLFDT